MLCAVVGRVGKGAARAEGTVLGTQEKGDRHMMGPQHVQMTAGSTDKMTL